MAAFLRRLALAIDTAMGMSVATASVGVDASFGGDVAWQQHGAAAPGGRTSARQCVADLLLVRARPLYGFYEEERLFVKVML